MTSALHPNTQGASGLRFAPMDGAGRGAELLRLRPSGDGWSLVSIEGDLVYSALGSSGRRRCVEFAHEHGVLALVG
jgi:hypothetical protein